MRRGSLRPGRPGRAAPGVAPLTDPKPQDAFERTRAALGPRYRLDRLVAASSERVLFEAYDQTLRRRVSLRINFHEAEATRIWFMREAEALGQLDHPAIRHVYDAGIVGDIAFRCGNWIDGEGLDQAIARGPRPIPTVIAMARDLVSAVEHAHLRGIIVRRIPPSSVIVSAGGRGDDHRPPLLQPRPPGHSAEHRSHGQGVHGARGSGRVPRGIPTSDVYTAGALLYFAVTGQRPPLEHRDLRPPTDLRPTCPKVIERLVLRAMQPAPEDRYLSAAEMLEDLTSDAGTFETRAATIGEAAITTGEDRARFEKRLRRALGDDYELLGDAGKRRVRPGLPGPRSPPGARGGAQGAAPVADPGP